MKIFIRKNGKRKGPYSPLQLKEMLAKSEISMSDRAWYEGCAEWSRIQEMPELIQAFSQTPASKPKVKKPSPPFFQTKIQPLFKKIKTQRTVQVAIVCVTVIILFAVWKFDNESDSLIPKADNKPSEIHLDAMRTVLKQDHDLAAAMQIKRKEVPANTDENLSAIGSAIKTYATNGLRIDLSACPHDFGEAYTRIFTAWQREADAISKHPHIPDGSGPIVEGFFRNLDQDVIDPITEPPEGMADWFGEVTSAEHAVQDARQTVEALTTRYGLRTPL